MRTLLPVSLRHVGFAASLFLLGACQPMFILPGGSGVSTSCPQGTYRVTSEVLSSVLPTAFGDVRLTPVAGGTLTLTVDATSWTFAGTQNIDVSGTSRFGVLGGVATATVDAGGAWAKTSSTKLNFSVLRISGTAAFVGTVSGVPVNLSVSLADIGMDKVYGFSGNANFSCGNAPNLTLTFTSVKLRFDRS